MTVLPTRRAMIAGAAASAIAAPQLARAQAWPSGTIRIICGTAAGGLTDLFSRAMATTSRSKRDSRWWSKTGPAPRAASLRRR